MAKADDLGLFRPDGNENLTFWIKQERCAPSIPDNLEECAVACVGDSHACNYPCHAVEGTVGYPAATVGQICADRNPEADIGGSGIDVERRRNIQADGNEWI